MSICIAPFFKKGDLRPSGFLDWYEWACVQYRSGLGQRQCEHLKWLFPQEFPCDHQARQRITTVLKRPR